METKLFTQNIKGDQEEGLVKLATKSTEPLPAFEEQNLIVEDATVKGRIRQSIASKLNTLRKLETERDNISSETNDPIIDQARKASVHAYNQAINALTQEIGQEQQQLQELVANEENDRVINKKIAEIIADTNSVVEELGEEGADKLSFMKQELLAVLDPAIPGTDASDDQEIEDFIANSQSVDHLLESDISLSLEEIKKLDPHFLRAVAIADEKIPATATPEQIAMYLYEQELTGKELKAMEEDTGIQEIVAAMVRLGQKKDTTISTEE